MNVYADLGLADAGEMLIKAQLVSAIAAIIKRRRMTLDKASTLLGIAQAELTDILRGNFRNTSGTTMLQCLTLLGHDVQIVIIKTVSGSRKIGHMSVLSA